MKVRVCIILLVMIFSAGLAAAADFISLKAAGNRYWPERDNQASLLQAINFYTSALQIIPEDKDLLTSLSIAYYWKGTNIQEEKKEERKKAFTTGKKYAQKLCELNPESVEGNFWYTVNQASYGGEIGVMKSAFMLPDIKKRMKIVMDQEKFYYHGGPQRLLARIDYKKPKFLRGSLEKAENMLKDAIKDEHNFTLSHIYLADIYMTMKKPNLARKELQFVLELSEDAMPEYEAEIRRDKRRATALIKKYFGTE
ncbi:MAG: hypothetical protein JRG81_02225 [Deltaproteobacteria bacterium]|nr:hypothetical protein [Deltaproteobacteria bacterium]